MDVMDSSDAYDAETMYTQILEYINDSNKYHLILNRREACCKIHDRIKRNQAEWKEALLSTQSVGKVLQRLFKSVVKDILQVLPILGESGS